MKFCPSCHNSYPNHFLVCPRDNETLKLAAAIEPGLILNGKYKVLAHIGSGGMADVYRVEHRAFHEEMAIKVVRAAFADDESFNHRFKSEAVLTRKLSHPNAIAVHDFDVTEDGRPFIVMELARGGSLKQLLRKNGALPAAEALDVARQVAAALAAAHALGVTHRDIKPDNILIVEEGGRRVAKVLDFGIARVKEGAMEAAGVDHTATKTGMVVGTPQYMSPEQAEGKVGDKIDGRADIYSLGVVLYEMLTGDLPFHADTPMGFVLARLSHPPAPMRAMRGAEGLEEPLRRLVMHALEREPSRRFPSMSAMLSALEDPAHWELEDDAREASTRIGSPDDLAEAATYLRPTANAAAGEIVADGGRISEGESASDGAAGRTQPIVRRSASRPLSSISDETTPEPRPTPRRDIVEAPAAAGRAAGRRKMQLSRIALSSALLALLAIVVLYWRARQEAPTNVATQTTQQLTTSGGATSDLPTTAGDGGAKTGAGRPNATKPAASAQTPTTQPGAALPRQETTTPTTPAASAAIPAAAAGDVRLGDGSYADGDYQMAVNYYRSALQEAPGNAIIKAKLDKALKARGQ